MLSSAQFANLSVLKRQMQSKNIFTSLSLCCELWVRFFFEDDFGFIQSKPLSQLSSHWEPPFGKMLLPPSFITWCYITQFSLNHSVTHFFSYFLKRLSYSGSQRLLEPFQAVNGHARIQYTEFIHTLTLTYTSNEWKSNHRTLVKLTACLWIVFRRSWRKPK